MTEWTQGYVLTPKNEWLGSTALSICGIAGLTGGTGTGTGGQPTQVTIGISAFILEKATGRPPNLFDYEFKIDPAGFDATTVPSEGGSCTTGRVTKLNGIIEDAIASDCVLAPGKAHKGILNIYIGGAATPTATINVPFTA